METTRPGCARDGASIHLIDDDEAVRDSLISLFRSRGFSVSAYASAEEFLERLPELHPDCIITDLQMQGISGFELLRRLDKAKVAAPKIVITGRGARHSAAEAAELGAAAYVEKPFEPEAFISLIRKAIGKA